MSVLLFVPIFSGRSKVGKDQRMLEAAVLFLGWYDFLSNHLSTVHQFQSPYGPCIRFGWQWQTSTLYRMKLGDDYNVENTTPTEYYNIETWGMEGMDACTFYDFAGQYKIRRALYAFLGQANKNDGIIFVVDSTRADCIHEAREELHPLFERCDRDQASLLILANKQDLPNAMSSAQITEELGLQNLRSPYHCRWHVQPCSAMSGDGLREGLEWLLPGRGTLVQKPKREEARKVGFIQRRADTAQGLCCFPSCPWRGNRAVVHPSPCESQEKEQEFPSAHCSRNHGVENISI